MGKVRILECIPFKYESIEKRKNNQPIQLLFLLELWTLQRRIIRWWILYQKPEKIIC